MPKTPAWVWATTRRGVLRHTRARLYTQLATDTKDEQPTIQAVDEVLERTKHRDAAKHWRQAYTRLNDSFQRAQLAQIAREAALEGVRTTSPKSDIIKALLEQRFALTDPTMPLASKFVRLHLSAAFCLAQDGHALFHAARDVHATVAIDKHDGQMGVMITGTPFAIQQMQAWLSAFEARIQRHVAPYAMPPRLLSWISRRTHCYAALRDGASHLAYMNADDAVHALMLMEQQTHMDTISWADLWCVTPDKSASVSALPFSASSVADPLDEYALQQGSWSRLVGTSAEPSGMLVPIGESASVDVVGALEAGARSDVPTQATSRFVGGAWTSRLSLTFGHVVWHDMLCSTRALTDAPERPARFIETEVPNTATAPPHIPGWAETATHDHACKRAYYRGGPRAFPLDLVVEYDDHDKVRAAWWEYAVHITIVCPFAPMDARMTMRHSAPAVLTHDFPTQTTIPPHVTIPLGNVDTWRLWRTERVVQRSSTYTHPEHTSDVVVHLNAVQRNSMPHFSRTTHVDVPMRTHDHVGILTSLLRTSYLALGRNSF